MLPRVTELDPKNPFAYINIAAILLQDRTFPGINRSAAEIAAISPDGQGYSNLGIATFT